MPREKYIELDKKVETKLLHIVNNREINKSSRDEICKSEGIIELTEKPMNLRQRRIFYKYIYTSNSYIADFINTKAAIRFSIKEIEDRNSVIRKYIFNFFKEMSSNLNLWETLCQIIREYLVMGNCVIFSEDNIIEETPPLEHDKNVLYKGWKKLIMLPLDQVRVSKIPLSNRVLLEYKPDYETLCHIKNKDDVVSEFPIKDTNMDCYTTLNTDSSLGSFATIFRNLSIGYDIMGMSSIERYIEDIKKDKDISMNIPEPTMELIKYKLKRFVEEDLFKPVSIKKGFVDYDNNAIYPEVSIS